jgi:DNA polymerase-3 subunit gamma/tau
MSEYKVIARKYRPKRFSEVLGQDAIVTTLKNAIKHKRLAHAYLFCGSRGTGKTTLARVFAKALNCQNPTEDLEPCNECASCREITSGSSLDVIEIDGASHRGIDDIRQINENVGYTTTHGDYKIYIIDEVHMLTKEAFNALLKTLEEPPEKVKFFFATTEPHKVLPTILSRCQRFNLNRISTDKIVEKLKSITIDQNTQTPEEVLHLIAQRAEGGLRDAESIYDQMLAFHEGTLTLDAARAILGMMPRESFFALDKAGKEGNLKFAFELVHTLFTEGKDLQHFLDSLTEHFRTILLVKQLGAASRFLNLSDSDQVLYTESSKLYSQEQCLDLMEYLLNAQTTLRQSPSPRVALESILLRVLRSHHRIPVDVLVRRLIELESKFSSGGASQSLPPTPATPPPPQPQTQAPPPPKAQQTPPPPPPPEPRPQPAAPQQPAAIESNSRYDTLLQFAAVELEGSVQRKTT